MPDEKEPISVFAKRIKTKYPEYADVNDTLLVQKIVEKYPEYADQVDLSGVSEVKKKRQRHPFWRSFASWWASWEWCWPVRKKIS